MLISRKLKQIQPYNFKLLIRFFKQYLSRPLAPKQLAVSMGKYVKQLNLDRYLISDAVT